MVLSKEDRQETAFTTHEGLHTFKAMPFGLCNAPLTFSWLMTLVLRLPRVYRQYYHYGFNITLTDVRG